MKSNYLVSDANSVSETGDNCNATTPLSADLNQADIAEQTIAIEDGQTDSGRITVPSTDTASEDEGEEEEYHLDEDEDDEDTSSIAAEDDIADEEEIDSLVKESQMTLDDLLATYGIPASSACHSGSATNGADTSQSARTRGSRLAARHAARTPADEGTVSVETERAESKHIDETLDTPLPVEERVEKTNKWSADDSALPVVETLNMASPNKRSRLTATSSDSAASVPMVGSPNQKSASRINPDSEQEQSDSPTHRTTPKTPSDKVSSSPTYPSTDSTQKTTTHEHPHNHHHSHHHHHHHRPRQLLSRSSHTSPTRHQRPPTPSTTNVNGDAHSSSLSSQRSSHWSPLSSRRRATSLSQCTDVMELPTAGVHLPGRRGRHESTVDVEQPEEGKQRSTVTDTLKEQSLTSVNGQGDTEINGQYGEDHDGEDSEDDDEDEETSSSKGAANALTEVYPDHFWQRAIVEDDSSHSYNSDEDEDYSPSSESADDWRGEIRVGDDYQAPVPSATAPTVNTLNTSLDQCTSNYTNGELASRLWHPGKLSENEVIHYQRLFARSLVHSLPSQRTVDDEEALFTLMQCNYNVDEALQRLSFRKVPPAEIPGYIDTWSEADALTFEKGFAIYNKDFRQIKETRLRHKTVGELVHYYYLWKKTARYDEFARVYRRDKKRSHPSITDFMDCLAIEQEAIADSYIPNPTSTTASMATPTTPRSFNVVGQPSSALITPQSIPNCYCPLSPLTTQVTTIAAANPSI